MIEVLLGASIAITSGVIGFYISKKITSANFETLLNQAHAKSATIEHEAHMLLEKAKMSVKEIKSEIREEEEKLELQLQKRVIEVENDIKQKEKDIQNNMQALASKQARLLEDDKLLKNSKQIYDEKTDNLIVLLENVSGLTKVEAKQSLLDNIEEKSREEIAHIVRKYEEEAKKEGSSKANYIIAQATTRYAGTFMQERLTNIVTLPNDDLKGRIIGKEGRNIKTLEMVLGVDIIIDDTPNAIILSSFNLYRRAIATKTLELLIEDGRIQPSRIEEIYQKTVDEFDEMVLKEGEDIIVDLGITGIHPELTKLIGRLRFRASYGQNALTHTLEVAYLAGLIAGELGGDVVLARRAGLLHDIGKSLTHDKGGNHVDLGADICTRYHEGEVIINAIYAHHGLQNANTIECAAVCTADALSAGRPGARREVLESYLKRVTEIEEIAMKKEGVRSAYAINAGRELRIIANAELLNDDEAILLAKEISKEVEENVTYPGDIKINVIRELRAIEYAR